MVGRLGYYVHDTHTDMATYSNDAGYTIVRMGRGHTLDTRHPPTARARYAASFYGARARPSSIGEASDNCAEVAGTERGDAGCGRTDACKMTWIMFPLFSPALLAFLEKLGPHL